VRLRDLGRDEARQRCMADQNDAPDSQAHQRMVRFSLMTLSLAVAMALRLGLNHVSPRLFAVVTASRLAVSGGAEAQPGAGRCPKARAEWAPERAYLVKRTPSLYRRWSPCC